MSGYIKNLPVDTLIMSLYLQFKNSKEKHKQDPIGCFQLIFRNAF